MGTYECRRDTPMPLTKHAVRRSASAFCALFGEILVTSSVTQQPHHTHKVHMHTHHPKGLHLPSKLLRHSGDCASPRLSTKGAGKRLQSQTHIAMGICCPAPVNAAHPPTHLSLVYLHATHRLRGKKIWLFTLAVKQDQPETGDWTALPHTHPPTGSCCASTKDILQPDCGA